MTKVAVFPASGRIGSSIYANLFKILPPIELVLISRHPEKTPDHLLKAGVEARKADFDDADSLEHAFDGVSCLILISYPSIETDHRSEVCVPLQSLAYRDVDIVSTNLADDSRFTN